MSESIAQMDKPGTYVEVRAEGLIAATTPATGNIGICGTAAKGAVDDVVALGSYAEAVDAFGAYDPVGEPLEENNPLTLVRALEQAYSGGARNVFAVRAANGDPAPSSLDVQAEGAQAGFTLTANVGGTWGNLITVVTESTTVDGDTVWKLSITYRNAKEVFTGQTVGDIHTQIADPDRGSGLVDVGDVENASSGFDVVDEPLAGGSDGADVSNADLARSLAELAPEPVNILLVAGGTVSEHGNIVLAHVEQTENDGRERIAFLGGTSSGTPTSADDLIQDTEAVTDDRVVVCAPGMVTTDAASDTIVELPPAYTAAIVAGKVATLAPHISLTNKGLPMTPDVRYSSALVSRLLLARILMVQQKFGAQVVKAITSSPKPFDQISIRRIVDFAKAGVRSGSDPYIGRLNNARVRAALQATLDGFLSQMVLDEMLISYDLEVSATRAQEIRGIASVVMTLRPTFSIDFIRVTMNLE
jgi:hypothetical protein